MMPTGIAASSDQTGYYQDNGQQYQQPQQTPQLALTAPTHNSAGTTIAGHTSGGTTEQQDVINTNGINTSVSPTGWEQSPYEYHDRQWSSNACLPTMVCAQHTHVQLGTWTRATAENSNR